MKTISRIAMLMLLSTGRLATAGALNPPLLEENFDYPDGPALIAPGSIWVHHSGQTNDLSIVDHQLALDHAHTEDLHAPLPINPADPPSAIYASFRLHFTQVPSGEGNYFLHLKDHTSTGFRARVYATTNDCPTNSIRLGLANGSSDASVAVYVDLPIPLGETHTVVVRYRTAEAKAALWLNPEAEDTPCIEALDEATPLGIQSIAVRQAKTAGNSTGCLLLDDLRVGLSFEAVAAQPQERLPVLEVRSWSELEGCGLELRGIAQQSYTIECAEDLGQWRPWIEVGPLEQATTNLLDPDASQTQLRFYRARPAQP